MLHSSIKEQKSRTRTFHSITYVVQMGMTGRLEDLRLERSTSPSHGKGISPCRKRKENLFFTIIDWSAFLSIDATRI